MDEAALKLIALFEEMSPEIWAAAQACVQAKIAGTQVVFWVSVIFGVLLLAGLIVYFATDGADYDDGMIGCALAGFLGAAAIVAVTSLVSLTKMRAAPDWYAIKEIAKLLSGGL